MYYRTQLAVFSEDIPRRIVICIHPHPTLSTHIQPPSWAILFRDHSTVAVRQFQPWLAEGSDDILQPNMIVSVEPGIYIPEVGGFRHSDTILITEDGYEILTKYPSDLNSLIFTSKKLHKKLKGQIIRRAVGIN